MLNILAFRSLRAIRQAAGGALAGCKFFSIHLFMEFFIRHFHRARPARGPGRAALAPFLPTTSSAPRRPCAVVPSPVRWTRPRSGPMGRTTVPRARG